MNANLKPIPTRASLGLSAPKVEREPAVPAPAKADPYDVFPSGWPSLRSSIWHRPGNVIIWSGVEYVAERVSDSSAVFKKFGRVRVERTTAAGEKVSFEAREDRVIRISSTHEAGGIVRRLSREEYHDFFRGRSPGAEKQTQTKPGEQERTVTDMAKKTSNKAVKKSGLSMAGSGKMVRELCAQGVSKTETFKRVIAKYPHFADGNDAAGLESRWAMAEQVAKNAKAAAKSKPAAKKSAPAKRTAPKRAAAKTAPVRPTPPPQRPAAPAALVAAAPAAEPTAAPEPAANP